ncbi:pyridoxal-phosphate-dependent aminotransferase family protein [Alteromonas ponticola]|uniref:Alanine--glyoxylate aminotransferase family protein n=1 Tax=Alteromonas ponticola TaxID=2720613 RepID=A0ABX1QW08_9ALTE|nr:alanine--glyoxylate aminotransferase family protein [Alteromonas ponticola]NMH58440.1 alanine--glyoxylate aminotransferase family protein [Alteromonas ponticola]
MGPGPSDVSPRVLNALGRSTIGHLDPAFVMLMDETKALLQYAFQTKNSLTLPVSAPGSAGMEACFVNLIEPGDKVIICINGVFGKRMVENVIRCGGEPITIDSPWGQQTSADKLELALKSHQKVKAVAMVHAETSTGVRNDVEQLCAIAKNYDCLTIVDAVTSLGGIEVNVDKWQIDAIYSGSQKCLSCIPGISPVSFSEHAVEIIKQRQHPVQSWFLDMNLIMGYWGEGSRSYHHTAPVNSLYALHEALLILKQEGLQNAWNRHKQLHQKLVAGLAEMGLSMLVEPDARLPQLNTVRVPEGIDEARVRKVLLEEFQLEIGAGLGELSGKVWRIGLMGHGCSQRNVDYCLAALKSVLK